MFSLKDKPYFRRVLLCGGVVLSFAAGFLCCYWLATHHLLPPTDRATQHWADIVRSADAIIVTQISDARTLVIQQPDPRFREIVNKTAHRIEFDSHVPSGMYPKCVVTFRGADGNSVEAVYTGKHIIIYGYHFMTPYDFFELFYS
jgi:hypothetical protein